MTGWRKSSFSKIGDCVEVAHGGSGLVMVRDSYVPGDALYFTHAEWDAFIAGVKAGEFDREVLS